MADICGCDVYALQTANKWKRKWEQWDGLCVAWQQQHQHSMGRQACHECITKSQGWMWEQTWNGIYISTGKKPFIFRSWRIWIANMMGAIIEYISISEHSIIPATSKFIRSMHFNQTNGLSSIVPFVEQSKVDKLAHAKNDWMCSCPSHSIPNIYQLRPTPSTPPLFSVARNFICQKDAHTWIEIESNSWKNQHSYINMI